MMGKCTWMLAPLSVLSVLIMAANIYLVSDLFLWRLQRAIFNF